jgi:hypothetical protein
VTTRTRIGFIVYFAILVLLAIRGIQLLAGQFLPYQATIVGMPWADIPPNFQLIIAFLNKYAGGVLVVFCLCISTLLLFPYRQGARWAVFAVPGLLLAYCTASANSMTQVLFAEPPIKPIAVFVVAIVVAFVVSVSGKKTSGV